MSLGPTSPGAESGARSALRAPGTAWGGPPPGTPSRVLRIDPPDGARGVFRDTPIVACLSRAIDARTASTETFAVMDEQGAVPGGIWTSLDGRIVVWTPGRLLAAGSLHSVRLSGLRDVHGREVSVHESVFVPGPVGLDDLPP